jgi:rhodanese-related sulfurtransferase
VVVTAVRDAPRIFVVGTPGDGERVLRARGWKDRRVTPQEVGEAFLLDVREPDEWDAVRAPGAVHVPMHDVPQRLDVLPKDRAIAVICHVGARSAQVAQWLRAQGYDAHNVDGGLIAWHSAGLPVEMGQP